MAKNENFQPRNARTPKDDGGPYYILVEGAPQHYVDGYGLCRGGALVTLPPGVEPGKYYVEIPREEYEKASADPAFAQQLAAVGKAKASQRQAEDRERKRQRDQAALAAQNEAAVSEAAAAAAALQAQAEAERKAREASETANAAEEARKAAEQALADERGRLAAAEAELQKYREREEAQKQQAAKSK